VDAPGVCLEPIEGEAEVLPGVSLIPTPGHTPGHQSVLVRDGETRVLIAGQAAYSAREFAYPREGHPAGLDAAWDREQYLASIARLHRLGPAVVHFSHDEAVWESGGGTDE
jgi:glyoxylase-like metal-dependent hydrolase (beta-lactamase superfamily II)